MSWPSANTCWYVCMRPVSVECVRRAWCCMTASKVWCWGALAGAGAGAGGARMAALTSSARSDASRSASAEPGSACSARRRSSTCHTTLATPDALLSSLLLLPSPSSLAYEYSFLSYLSHWIFSHMLLTYNTLTHLKADFFYFRYSSETF